MTRKKALGGDTHGIYGLPKFFSPPSFHTSSVLEKSSSQGELLALFLRPFTMLTLVYFKYFNFTLLHERLCLS